MALFDFRDLDKHRKIILNEPKIELDDNLYIKSGKYGKIQKISFENQYGRAVLSGYFDLRNLNVGELIKLSKFAIKYDPKFKEICSKHFQAPKVYIWFNIDSEEKAKFQIHELKMILEKIEAERLDEAERSKFSLNMIGLRDFNLNECFNDIYENKSEYKSLQSELNENLLHYDEMITKIEKPKKKFNDKLSKEISYDKEHANGSERIDEVEIASEEKNKKKLPLVYGSILNDNFIDFEKDDQFKEYFVLSKKMEKEKTQAIFTNPYQMTIDKRNLKKDVFNYSFRPCFNHKGEFVTLKSENNSDNLRFSLNIHKICPNKNLISKNSGVTSFYDYYKKNTFLSYIDLLSEQLNKKKLVSNQMNIEELDIKKKFSDKLLIEDHSQLLNHYVKNLENFKKHIKEMMSNIQNEVEDIRVLSNIVSYSDREISTVKLFAILFVDCFPQKRKSDGEDGMVQSMRVEVRKQRKRSLLDWLVESKEGIMANVKKIFIMFYSCKRKNREI